MHCIFHEVKNTKLIYAYTYVSEIQLQVLRHIFFFGNSSTGGPLIARFFWSMRKPYYEKFVL